VWNTSQVQYQMVHNGPSAVKSRIRGRAVSETVASPRFLSSVRTDRVRIAATGRRAERDLEDLYLWVIQRGAAAGCPVVQRCRESDLFTRQHPKRCPVAAESFDPGHPVRVLTYGRKPHAYRIFFTVDDDAEIVRVVHVRRGARQKPMAGELR
jgi:toxin ParE1/3/4